MKERGGFFRPFRSDEGARRARGGPRVTNSSASAASTSSLQPPRQRHGRTFPADLVDDRQDTELEPIVGKGGAVAGKREEDTSEM